METKQALGIIKQILDADLVYEKVGQVLGIDLSKYYEIISDDGRINLIFGTNNNKDTKQTY